MLSWKDLQKLRVVSCKNIKDSEASPALSTLFSTLKELQWRPSTRSLLSSCLVESIYKEDMRTEVAPCFLQSETLMLSYLV